MIDVQRSNGVDSVYGYDTAGRLDSIAHTNGASVIDEFVYTLDGNGNRVGATTNAGTESYTLDGFRNRAAAALGTTSRAWWSESRFFGCYLSRFFRFFTGGTTSSWMSRLRYRSN